MVASTHGEDGPSVVEEQLRGPCVPAWSAGGHTAPHGGHGLIARGDGGHWWLRQPALQQQVGGTWSPHAVVAPWDIPAPRTFRGSLSTGALGRLCTLRFWGPPAPMDFGLSSLMGHFECLCARVHQTSPHLGPLGHFCTHGLGDFQAPVGLWGVQALMVFGVSKPPWLLGCLCTQGLQMFSMSRTIVVSPYPAP